MVLTFAGGGDLRVEVECLDAVLADVGAALADAAHARSTRPSLADAAGWSLPAKREERPMRRFRFR